MEPEPPQTVASVVLGLSLTAIAGFVNTVGFLTLGHILPANMSGNTVEGGLGWLQGDVAQAVRKLLAVLLFCVGAFFSATLHVYGRRRGLRRVVPATLLVEIVLLALWCGVSASSALASRPELAPLSLHALAPLTLAPLAMGIQNASLTQVGPVRAFTTHVTGTLTHLAESFAAGKKTPSAIMAGLWLSFFAGGLAGGAATHAWGARSLVFAIVGLAGVTVWTTLRPTLTDKSSR